MTYILLLSYRIYNNSRYELVKFVILNSKNYRNSVHCENIGKKKTLLYRGHKNTFNFSLYHGE